MADVSDLVLEQLRFIRGELGKLANAFMTLSAEMRAVRQHVSGVQSLQDHDHTDIAELKMRVERIERRLDLVD